MPSIAARSIAALVAFWSIWEAARKLIANALRTQSEELLETQPELFAWHYAEAGLAEQSAGFWAKAGQRSAARSALSCALSDAASYSSARKLSATFLNASSTVLRYCASALS